MRWLTLVGMALLVGCSFDTDPNAPKTGAATSSEQATSTETPTASRDAAGRTDAADPALTDARTADAAMVTTQNVPSASDASVTPGQPSKSPDASTKPEPTKDASTPPDAASTPPPQVPTTPPTDGGMAVDAEIPAGRPAQRAQLTLLLQTAGLSRDDRALIGLVTLMVGSAMSGEDLLDVLAPLEKAGNCMTFGQFNCATVCAIVASRCSLCTAESGCLAAGQRVCGFEGMNCR